MTHKFEKKILISRILNLIDHILFFVFIGVLIVLIATSTKVNISHDSVDYYAILQWVTPEKEKPIVRNLHFAEQRSPGYPLLSLIPYSLLTIFVEPFVTTEKITEYAPPEFPRGPGSRFTEEQRNALRQKGEELRAQGASRQEVHEAIRQMLDNWGIKPPPRKATQPLEVEKDSIPKRNAVFSATIIGSGSPVYNPERSGPSVLIRYKDTYILVDMGNGTQARLYEAGINLRQINGSFFTHHHLDHNEEFIPIFIGLILGGKPFLIAGPENTLKYTASILSLYKEDIEYRLGRTNRTFNDVKDKYKVKELKGNETFVYRGISISTAKVNHTIYTIAYRFDADGKSIVVSGDLIYSPSLPALAKDANVLIMDAGRVIKKPKRGGKYRIPPPRPLSLQKRAHPTLDEVGRMAKEANVKKLVLTHFTKGEIDEEATRNAIAKYFKGEIIFGYDLLEITVTNLTEEQKVEELRGHGASRQEMREVGIKPPRRDRGFPPQHIFIKDLFFKDYYIPTEGSWYQWKLALSLLLTSFFFLFIGIWANAKVLKLYYPAGKCLFIIPATLVTSHMFMRSIFDLPLFTTLTYYGLASLLLLFICLSFRSNKAWYVILSGLILGLLVLTRLELSILAVLLIGYFLFTKRIRFFLLFSLGGLVAFLVLIVYNLSLFGVPLHFGILRGDINTLGLNWRYIFENLIHPESGVLFWTPLLIPGLVFLITAKDPILKVIGFYSFVLIIFYTLRIPIMYYHIGQGIIDTGGIPVTAPETPTQMRELTRFDINRYLCVLIPFSIIGIRIGIHKIYNLLELKNNAK